MFVGEAPGANEDRTGVPFVGRAGQLLDAMLRIAKVARDSVFITNVLKCRPPQNRDPEQSEIDTCSKILHAQIRLIQPRVLITLGRYAGNFLTGTKKTMRDLARLGGRYSGPGADSSPIPVVCLYHPAFFLRQGAGAKELVKEAALLLQQGVVGAEDFDL
jgi:DNA polymerase